MKNSYLYCEILSSFCFIQLLCTLAFLAIKLLRFTVCFHFNGSSNSKDTPAYSLLNSLFYVYSL